MGHEYLELVGAIGATDDDRGLELHADDTERDEVQARLPEGRPIIGIAPGAAFGPSKRWPAERYAAVADALANQLNAACVLITGPGEEETRDAVLQNARTTLILPQEGAPSIAGLKATIASLDLLVGNDSGPRHVAIAFKKPVICIMGPTSPRYSVGPWEQGEVLRVEVDCGPCQQPICVTDHRCMTRIPPEAVVEAVHKHLAAAAGRKA